MKKRNQFIKRIGVLVCVLFVAISCLGSPLSYRASINYDYVLPELVYEYPYYSLVEWVEGELRLIVSDSPLVYYNKLTNGDFCFGSPDSSVRWYSYWTTDGINWTPGTNCDKSWGLTLDEGIGFLNVFYENDYTVLLDYGKKIDISLPSIPSNYKNYILYFNRLTSVYSVFAFEDTICFDVSNFHNNQNFLYPCACIHGRYEQYRLDLDSWQWNLIKVQDTANVCTAVGSKELTSILACSYNLALENVGTIVRYAFEFQELSSNYNSSIGYLQNVSRKTTYIRGALYNYDEDSKTYYWYHDLLSSTGIDLTSGDYVIRHYVSEATVKGYEKEDIVRMTDRFLMAEYDASKGCFSYIVKDYDSRLYELGYEELGFIDVFFRGYFVLEHHYFQIVNIATNEVGGYLHLYPRDADPNNFGVELEYEGLDNNFEVDSDAPSGNTKPSTGSGETIEDALVNADAPKLDDLQGIDEFIDSLEMYSVQIKGVVGGISAFLGMFPPWLIGLVGFSLVMPFVVIVIKALRG